MTNAEGGTDLHRFGITNTPAPTDTQPQENWKKWKKTWRRKLPLKPKLHKEKIQIRRTKDEKGRWPDMKPSIHYCKPVLGVWNRQHQIQLVQLEAGNKLTLLNWLNRISFFLFSQNIKGYERQNVVFWKKSCNSNLKEETFTTLRAYVILLALVSNALLDDLETDN